MRPGDTFLVRALTFSLAIAGGCSGRVLDAPRNGADGSADSGDPGAPGALPPSALRVLISEIMYHPIADDAPASSYEFVEIYNATPQVVPLGGWRLLIDGQTRLTLPGDASISPGQYLVIAKDRSKLSPVYGLSPAATLGDYQGELGDGGGRLALLDQTGALADSVAYDDEPPWPIGADALGASEKWFAPDDPLGRAPFRNHKYKGISLERISFEVPGDEASNWAPSPLDGATPGKANVALGTPRRIAVKPTAARKEGEGLIRAGDEVVIHVPFSSLGEPPAAVEIEFFVDDPQKTGEKPGAPLAMTDLGGGYEVTLGKDLHKDNAIVRYRIWADRGARRELVSPRPSDPNAWHAYFVSPAKVIDDAAKMKSVCQLFIASSDWGRLWDLSGAQPSDSMNPSYPIIGGWGRETTGPLGTEDAGCTDRPQFNESVPAIFVRDGAVYDVLVRYSGGRFWRLQGEQLKSWLVPGPTRGPRPPLILAWSLSFPKYNAFKTDIAGKRTAINLKKTNFYTCPYFANELAGRLYQSVGLASARGSLVRYYVNGAYYGYMNDLGPVDDNIALRNDPGAAVAGDLFKANGLEEGPYRRTDATPLAPNPGCSGAPTSYPLCDETAVPPVTPPLCSTQTIGWSNEVWQLYQYNYGRETYQWKEVAIRNAPDHPPDEVQNLLEGLEAARKLDCPSPADAAISCAEANHRKRFLEDSFDLEKLRDYIALRNWAGPWDDNHHNYYLYRKASDRKWMIIGWDFELEYGGGYDFKAKRGPTSVLGLARPSMSFYTGEEGNPDNLGGTVWNRIKDAYLKSFRTDFNRRLRQWAGLESDPAGGAPILRPDNFNKVVDEIFAGFDMNDFNEAATTPAAPDRYPTSYQCRPQDFKTAMKQWALDRNAELARQIPRP